MLGVLQVGLFLLTKFLTSIKEYFIKNPKITCQCDHKHVLCHLKSPVYRLRYETVSDLLSGQMHNLNIRKVSNVFR